MLCIYAINIVLHIIDLLATCSSLSFFTFKQRVDLVRKVRTTAKHTRSFHDTKSSPLTRHITSTTHFINRKLTLSTCPIPKPYPTSQIPSPQIPLPPTLPVSPSKPNLQSTFHPTHRTFPPATLPSSLADPPILSSSFPDICIFSCPIGPTMQIYDLQTRMHGDHFGWAHTLPSRDVGKQSGERWGDVTGRGPWLGGSDR